MCAQILKNQLKTVGDHWRWSGIGYGWWVYCGCWDYGDGELWIGFGLGRRGLRSCWDNKASPATLIAFSLVIQRRLRRPSGEQEHRSPWAFPIILIHAQPLILIPPFTNTVIIITSIYPKTYTMAWILKYVTFSLLPTSISVLLTHVPFSPLALARIFSLSLLYQECEELLYFLCWKRSGRNYIGADLRERDWLMYSIY